MAKKKNFKNTGKKEVKVDDFGNIITDVGLEKINEKNPKFKQSALHSSQVGQTPILPTSPIPPRPKPPGVISTAVDTPFGSFIPSGTYCVVFIEEVLVSTGTGPFSSAEPDDWVGVFHGDLLVGAYQWDTSQCMGGICSIYIYGQDGQWLSENYPAPGDIISFKFYETSSNTIVENPNLINPSYYSISSDSNTEWDYSFTGGMGGWVRVDQLRARKKQSKAKKPNQPLSRGGKVNRGKR